MEQKKLMENILKNTISTLFVFFLNFEHKYQKLFFDLSRSITQIAASDPPEII